MALKFVHICDLLEQLETIELRDVPRRNREKQDELGAAVQQWFRNHATGVANNQLALLSLLLPHRRPDRMYHVQEKSLVRYLERILRLGSGRVKALRAWTVETDLATLVYRIERETDAGRPPCTLSVSQLNDELDQLASMSNFSSSSIRAFRDLEQSRCSVLERIIGPLRARELKWFIRILLKRLDPVIFQDIFIMQHVHSMLPTIMRFHSSLEVGIELLRNAADSIPSDLREGEAFNALQVAIFQRLSPKPGQQLRRASYFSARSVKDLLRMTGKFKWAVQPKYDGEYCQVHIDLSKGRDCIRMFSKSGKESTNDRKAVHQWVKRCLNIGGQDCKIKKNCILEGEMVVYNDRNSTIMGFNKIRRHVTRGGRYIGTEKDSPPRRWEHLMVVFFDVLLHDDSALVFEGYETRSRALQGLLIEQPSRVLAPRWGIIDLAKQAYDEATKKIEILFVQAICQRCEGLVLKDVDSPYYSKDVELGRPYNNIIKLKKDKITGLGDLVDFAIIGAYRKAADAMTENLRQMRWTRFTLACLTNKDSVQQHGSRPKFKVLGSVGPGCVSPSDMKTISEIGQFEAEDYIEGKHPSRFDIEKDIFAEPMSAAFRTPFIAELCGSGFERPYSQDYYMLRFPRVTKLHNDRSIEDIVSFEELQDLARTAIKLPDDMNKEEQVWHKRLREQARGKRRIMNDTSPSDLGSSPSSRARTSLMSSVSPLKTSPVFVRMDTQEMQPGDLQLVNSRSSRPIRSAAPEVLPTPPPTSSAALSSSKRKADSSTIPEERPSKRRLEVEEIKILPHNGKVTRLYSLSWSSNDTPNIASDTTLPPSSSPPRGAPLADITNSSPNRIRSPPRITPKKSSNKASEQEIHKSSPPIINISAPIPDKAQYHTAQLPFPDDQLDLSNRIFYLSPSLRNYKLIHALIPLATPHEPITTISHFKRDLLTNAEAPPLGPVVSESQAFPSLTKAALVETCLTKDVRRTVSELLTLRLASDETIEVWDWRILEAAVAQLDTNSIKSELWLEDHIRNDPRTYDDRFWQHVKRNGGKWGWNEREVFVGVVRFDEQKQVNVFESTAAYTQLSGTGKPA